MYGCYEFTSIQAQSRHNNTVLFSNCFSSTNAGVLENTCYWPLVNLCFYENCTVAVLTWTSWPKLYGLQELWHSRTTVALGIHIHLTLFCNGVSIETGKTQLQHEIIHVTPTKMPIDPVQQQQFQPARNMNGSAFSVTLCDFK